MMYLDTSLCLPTGPSLTPGCPPICPPRCPPHCPSRFPPHCYTDCNSPHCNIDCNSPHCYIDCNSFIPTTYSTVSLKIIWIFPTDKSFKDNFLPGTKIK